MQQKESNQLCYGKDEEESVGHRESGGSGEVRQILFKRATSFSCEKDHDKRSDARAASAHWLVLVRTSQIA